ncbi:MAG: hypothetical protein HYV28_14390 [Ignavibacteriales bacterium]|nr:hypothetical protein [Ignavibacteriales bacterium]
MKTPKDKKKHSAGQGLQFIAGSKHELATLQKKFNTLLFKTNKLQKKYITDKARLLELSERLGVRLVPLQHEAARIQIQLAASLSSALKTHKFGKEKVEEINEVICDMLHSAFFLIEPDEKALAMYKEAGGDPGDFDDEFSDAYMHELFSQGMPDENGIPLKDYDSQDDDNSGAIVQNKIFEKGNNSSADEEGKIFNLLAKPEVPSVDIPFDELDETIVNLTRMLSEMGFKPDELLKLDFPEHMSEEDVELHKARYIMLQILQWIDTKKDSPELFDRELLTVFIDMLNSVKNNIQLDIDLLYSDPMFDEALYLKDQTEEQIANHVALQCELCEGKINDLKGWLEEINNPALARKSVIKFTRDYFELYSDENY